MILSMSGKLQTYNYMTTNNPFLSKSREPHKGSMMDELMKQKQKKEFNTNIYDFSAKGSNENVSDNNPSHLFAAPSNKVAFKANFTQKKQVQVIQKKGPFTFQMKVNLKQCPVSQSISTYLQKRLFKTVKTDVRQSLPKIELVEHIKQVDRKVSFIKEVSQCLLILSKFIERNYDFLLNQILRVKGHLTNIQFFHPQLTRLFLGLHFYQPIKQNCLQFLEIILENHPLSRQTQHISKEFRLDILKSFYVAKQTYLFGKNINCQNYGFGLIVDRKFIRQNTNFANEARKFIEFDKGNMMKCYHNFLSKNVLPSSLKLCTLQQEICALWLNILNLSSQGSNIQQIFLELFTKFYKIAADIPSYKLTEQLEQMKRKLLVSLNPNIKKRLFEMNINQMLEQGDFINGQFAGHYQPLITLLIHKKQINYLKALDNIKEITTLSEKWVPHFEKYVNNMTLDSDHNSNMLKCIFILKILELLCKHELSEQCQKQLLKKVSSVSIQLSVSFLSYIRNVSLKIRHIKIIAKKEEKQLLLNRQNDGITMKKYLQLEGYQILKLYLEIIDNLFQYLLDSNDITFIEGAFSNGKSFALSWNLEQKVLYSTIFYTDLFFQFKSQQPRIQLSLNKFFHKLKSLNIEIETSFSAYDKQLRSKLQQPQLIAQHLQNSIELISRQQLTNIVEMWLNRFSQSTIRISFSLLVNFFISIANISIQTAQNIALVQITIRGIEMFRREIFDFLVSNFNQNGCMEQIYLNVLHAIKDLSHYCELTLNNNIFPRNFLIGIIKELKKKVQNQIEIIDSNDKLSMSRRLELVYLLLVPLKQQLRTSQDWLVQSLRQSKKTNIREISTKICTEIQKQKTFNSVKLLYSLFVLDKILSKMVTQELTIQLAESITSLKKITLLDVDCLIYVLINLQIDTKYISSQHQKDKIEILRKVIIAQIINWFKEQDPPALLFNRLVMFLMKSMNALKYQYHLFFLQKGIELNLFNSISSQVKNNLPSYGAYLICLMLGTKKRLNNFPLQDQTLKIKSELAAFTYLACLILKLHRNKEFDIRNQHFQTILLNTLIKCLKSCTKDPSLVILIKEHFKAVKKHIQAIIIEEKNIFEKQLKFVQDQLNMLNSSEADSSTQDFTAKECLNQEQFNILFHKGLTKLSKLQSEVSSRLHLINLTELLNKNKKFSLNSNRLDKNILNRMFSYQQTVFPFMSFLQTIFPRLTMSSDRNKVQLTQILMKQVDTISKDKSNIGQLKLTRQLISTFVIAVKSGFLSSFILLKKIHPHICYLMESLSNFLFKWQKPTDQLFLTLNECIIVVDCSMLKLPKHRFSLWNYLEYRERLLLINGMLQYARQMNGFDFKDQIIIEPVIRFMNFVMKNDQNLRSVDTLRKFLNAKAIINHGGQIHILELDYPEEPFDELKNICREISHSINRLKWDLTYEQVDRLAEIEKIIR